MARVLRLSRPSFGTLPPPRHPVRNASKLKLSEGSFSLKSVTPAGTKTAPGSAISSSFPNEFCETSRKAARSHSNRISIVNERDSNEPIKSQRIPPSNSMRPTLIVGPLYELHAGLLCRAKTRTAGTPSMETKLLNVCTACSHRNGLSPVNEPMVGRYR